MPFRTAVLLLLLAFTIQGLLWAQGSHPRGAVPLPQKFLETHKFDRWQSQGVFVGLSAFPKDGGVADIPYAVDDAVDLAHLFSLELALIPPSHVRLLLSGKPGKQESEDRLEALEAKGAQIIDAKPELASDEVVEKVGDTNG